LIKLLEEFEETTYSDHAYASYTSALELSQATSEIIKKIKSEPDAAGQRR